MEHRLKHEFDGPQAKRIADRVFAAYQDKYAKYSPTLRWLDDDRAEASFTAKGMTLKGEIELLPGALALRLEVPLLLRPFKAKALAIIDRELEFCAEAVTTHGLPYLCRAILNSNEFVFMP